MAMRTSELYPRSRELAIGRAARPTTTTYTTHTKHTKDGRCQDPWERIALRDLGEFGGWNSWRRPGRLRGKLTPCSHQWPCRAVRRSESRRAISGSTSCLLYT